MGQWLYWFFGLDNGSGSKYLFWSGFGAILERAIELAALAMILLRKHNCETHHCWRTGRHPWTDPTTGQIHRLCRKHHPLGHLTASGIQEVSRESATGTAATGPAG